MVASFPLLATLERRVDPGCSGAAAHSISVKRMAYLIRSRQHHFDLIRP